MAKASGKIPDVSLDQAILQAAGAAGLLATFVESARHYVTPAN